MEGHYLADNCAEYLGKFYILPHTYQEAFARRILVPIFAMGIVVPMLVACAIGLLFAAHHPQPTGHEKSAVLLFCIVGALAILFFASPAKAKLIISHNAIEVVGTFSKTKILGGNVLGYAADYVQPFKGRPGRLQFSVVHRSLEQQEARTRIYFDPNDLADAKLQGLFRSMHNYGSEALDDILVEVNGGKFTRENVATVVIFSGFAICLLWRIAPVIRSFLWR